MSYVQIALQTGSDDTKNLAAALYNYYKEAMAFKGTPINQGE